MNLPLVYFSLVCKRLENPLDKNKEYVERHHIIPKSEGGTDSKENLVNFTAREHYLAHHLLARIYNDSKMWLALSMMMFAKSDGQSRVEKKISDRTYEKMKKAMSEAARERFLGNTFNVGRIHNKEFREKISSATKGENNPMYGRRHSEETKRKISEKAKSRKPNLEAFSKISQANRGRTHWNNGTDEIVSNECPGEGFVKGRLTKGIHWYTDGKTEIQKHECPEGFRPGRITGLRKKQSI